MMSPGRKKLKRLILGGTLWKDLDRFLKVFGASCALEGHGPGYACLLKAALLPLPGLGEQTAQTQP